MENERILDQNRAPIYEALQTFRQMRVVPFDVPGHKRGRGNPELTEFLGEQCVSIDVNSMKPLDNLCHPISVIREAEELAAEVYAACGDPFWILLAHRNNRFARQYSLLGADLVCSGHAHGGIVRLPGTDGLFSHDLDLFPSYTAGLYEENGSVLFVTRGLGNSGPSFRVFNRPEIAVLTLRRAEG